jgi:uncharacterized membrane protein
MSRKWPIVLIAAAAAACAGKAGHDADANQASGAAANQGIPAGNSAAAPANTADAGSGTASAAPYEANGTEPFWGLAIGGGQMTYTPADGAPVTEPLPAQTPIANGYRYQGARLSVAVTHATCNNGMSERQYADTVAVAVAGETRNGCGGASTGPD